MKQMALVLVVCALSLSVGCNRKASDNTVADRNNNGSQTTGSVQQPGSVVDQTGTGTTAGNDTAGAAGTSGRIAGDQTAPTDPQQFIQQAAIGNMAEIELGNLAAQRGSSPQVKAFARMMVRDHTKANDQLKSAARAESVQLPAKIDQKHQDLMTRLQGLNGPEFDREYMQAMVDGHSEMRDLLNSRASTATRPTGTSGSTKATEASVNQWASNNLPTVEHHLTEAQQISSRLQSNTAPTSSDRNQSSTPSKR